MDNWYGASPNRNPKPVVDDSKLKLVPASDPILRQVTQPFDFQNPPVNPVELYNEMGEAMVEMRGLGLSAPQVGLPYRFFVISSDPIMGFFNPIIVDKSPETMELDEFCLSYPGITAKVSRPYRIRIRYTEPDGEVQTKGFEGMSARVILHELDHLNGIPFTSYLSRIQLDMAIRKAKKTAKKAYQASWLREMANVNV